MNQCHYDYIDFSVTVGSEAGTRGSSAGIRTWMKHLSEFIHAIDFVHARPLDGWIEKKPEHLVSTTLGVGERKFIAYLADAREVTDPHAGEPIGGEVAFRLPEGSYRASLYSPVSGGESPAIRVRGGAQPVTFELPAFRHDVVLRVERGEWRLRWQSSASRF